MVASATSGTTLGNADLTNFTNGSVNNYAGPATTAYQTYNGFDLVWSQQQLQSQMAGVEQQMQTIESNSNLSDTEKMFTMQMTMNSWSAISNLRTNMLKSVSDTLKSVARNIN